MKEREKVVYNNVLEAIGYTPMIRLNRMNKPGNAQVLVKFEGLNVGGSIKTRTALNMIEQAEKEGKIHPDTIIVEPTSGNQGIGLALVGAVKGYRTIIIMPDSVSEERRKLVRHYGAEVILIHDAGNIGACIEECLQTALRMERKTPMYLFPSSFPMRTIRRLTVIILPWRLWSRWRDRSTASVPESEPAVLLPVSVKC